MNMPTDALSGSAVQAQAVTSSEISAMRSFYWAVRRELWESRFLYVAPLGVAALMFCAFLFSLIHLPQKVRAASTLAPMQQSEAIMQPYDLMAALLMVTFILVAIFYCVETFQRERRDRSILFWKALPVSDATTVLAKASVPFLLLPLLTFFLTVAMQFIMLLISSAVLAADGLSVPAYWAQVSLLRSSLLLLYHLFSVHVLGAAPLYGWLMLVSAWARRAALIWAFVPPLAISAAEKLLFNSTHFAGLVARFFTGTGAEAISAPGTMPMDPMTHLTPAKLLGSPGLWIGLAVTALFLATAVRLRRRVDPV